VKSIKRKPRVSKLGRKPAKKKVSAKSLRNKRAKTVTTSRSFVSTDPSVASGRRIVTAVEHSPSSTTGFLSAAIKSLGARFSKRVEEEVQRSLRSEIKIPAETLRSGQTIKLLANGKIITDIPPAAAPDVIRRTIHITTSDLVSITPPSVSRTMIDDGLGGFIGGLRRIGPVSMTVNDAIGRRMLEGFRLGKLVDVDVMGHQFKAWVTRVVQKSSTDQQGTWDIELQPTGPITIKEETVSPKNTALPRFYVGSKRALQNGWAKYTEKEAIDHAKMLLEQTHEEQFVVKIIKRVRRKSQPIVVETVK
jgi:hypothetical protein